MRYKKQQQATNFSYSYFIPNSKKKILKFKVESLT